MGGVAEKIMTVEKRDVNVPSGISVKKILQMMLTNNDLTFTNNSFLKVFTEKSILHS